MEDFYIRFGASVKRHRRHQQLKQEQLAERTQMGRPTIASIEGGRQAVTLLQALRLSAVLGVELSQLVAEAQSSPLRHLHAVLEEQDLRIVQQLHDELI